MIEVICGPMYSGKSEELIRRLTRAHLGQKNVLAIKPEIDNRYSDQEIVSHSGARIAAITLKHSELLVSASLGYTVVGIDEAQFFDDEIVNQVRAMAHSKLVIVAGLDMTFRQEPFGSMPQLLAIADRVQKLTAVCHSCGDDANFTQRLVDGKPAPFDGPTVLVGATEAYEARCRKHFQSS